MIVRWNPWGCNIKKLFSRLSWMSSTQDNARQVFTHIKSPSAEMWWWWFCVILDGKLESRVYCKILRITAGHCFCDVLASSSWNEDINKGVNCVCVESIWNKIGEIYCKGLVYCQGWCDAQNFCFNYYKFLLLAHQLADCFQVLFQIHKW